MNEQIKLMQSPRPAALAALRTARPAFATAEEEHTAAEGRLVKAREAASKAEAEAQRVVDDVGAGKATPRQVDEVLRRAATAKAVLPGFTRAATDAGEVVLEERERALDALAASIRTRRERLRKALPETRVKDLEKVKAEELALFAEAGIRDLGGKRMLQNRDVGALLDWPVPVSVDLARASWKPAAGGTA